jgi:peptidyl-tRNA hydrolase, PTH1 family
MWLIVGLGNPGSKYLLTRHNVGWMALDFFVKAIGARVDGVKREHEADTITFNWDSEQIKLVKPQTFMNLSGESVGAIARFYKIEPTNILVLHDDMDQPFGQMRIKTKSGDGGHNGIKSLIAMLGTNDFPRIKIGIGRPAIAGMDPADYVLQNFSAQERGALAEILNQVNDAVETLVFEGLTKAMNTFNRKKEDTENGI